MQDTTFWILFNVGAIVIVLLLFVWSWRRTRPCVQPDTEPRRGPVSVYTPPASPLGMAWGTTRPQEG